MDEMGITADDRDRIRRFLDKPPYQRTAEDLLPRDAAQDETTAE